MGQPEVVEKAPRGGEQRRAARRIAVTDGLDPAAILQLPQDRGGDGDAADVLDVAARHRLAVGNDGQCLHGGARIARRLLGIEPVEMLAHVGAALETPAAGQRDQLDATAVPVARQLVEQRTHLGRLECVGQQQAHVAERHRFAGADQRGFEDTLGVLGVHAVEGRREPVGREAVVRTTAFGE